MVLSKTPTSLSLVKLELRVVHFTAILTTSLCSRDHPVLTWLVRYAATLIIVYHVGKDGKTAYQRREGKALNIPIVDFAER